jgi:hypothetical protein
VNNKNPKKYDSKAPADRAHTHDRGNFSHPSDRYADWSESELRNLLEFKKLDPNEHIEENPDGGYRV